MLIHSVSYEKGNDQEATPTLRDGYNWLEILKEGLLLRVNWPQQLRNGMDEIWNSLQNPEAGLPSFHRNSFSKLETTMQENLFELSATA